MLVWSQGVGDGLEKIRQQQGKAMQHVESKNRDLPEKVREGRPAGGGAGLRFASNRVSDQVNGIPACSQAVEDSFLRCQEKMLSLDEKLFPESGSSTQRKLSCLLERKLFRSLCTFPAPRYTPLTFQTCQSSTFPVHSVRDSKDKSLLSAEPTHRAAGLSSTAAQQALEATNCLCVVRPGLCGDRRRNYRTT